MPFPTGAIDRPWLRKAFTATALALVTTAPALAATDGGKIADFLLGNGMEGSTSPITARHSSLIWCGTRSAAPTSHLGEMMGFEADRMFNLILNENDQDRAKRDEERCWRRETNPQVCWTRRSTRHCGRISPTAFRSNGWMQEMEKLNGTETFTIYNKYCRPNDAVAGT
ncbi:hypothetical protein X743_32935 [Mesorhizobium sp. LNHC252B00]|nr:hypothetical protein X743_32935 [Mesorhizobium sp. LNHC252B00]